jgi:hypothetical protein
VSQVLIQHYLNQLQDLRKVSGTTRESVMRKAFNDLLSPGTRTRGHSTFLTALSAHGGVLQRAG